MLVTPPPPYFSDEKVANNLSSLVEKSECEYKKQMGGKLVVYGEVKISKWRIEKAHEEAVVSAIAMLEDEAQDELVRDFTAAKKNLGERMNNWKEKIITESGTKNHPSPFCIAVILTAGILILNMLPIIVVNPILWKTLNMRSSFSDPEDMEKRLGTSPISTAGAIITILISFVVIKICLRQMTKDQQPIKDHLHKFLSANGFSSDNSFLSIAV
jgi:hypothetical protein